MINVPGAMWGDVFPMGDGTIGCVYDQGKQIIVETFRFSGRSRVKVARARTAYSFPEQVLFVRGDIDREGNIIVMGQGNPSGKLYCNKPLPRELTTYGTHSCDIDINNGNFHFVCQISTTEYYDSLTNTTHPVPAECAGTSNGIIQVDSGGFVIWADLARASIAEMYYPFKEGDVYVGEGAADPPHIQSLENSIDQKIIYYGYAARPRACYDERSNTFAVAARSEHGVNFHFFHLPFVDISTPVIPPVEPPDPPVEPPPVIEPPEPETPDMACTPVVPPQDVIQRSMDSLRHFCQTYCFPGPNDHPYINDEIHENGLFIADGLIYFMMSDTGNWAKTLMNPDDKRDWESKRVSADNALFDYMRRRVGDAPASSSPGGALAGDVNV